MMALISPLMAKPGIRLMLAAAYAVRYIKNIIDYLRYKFLA